MPTLIEWGHQLSHAVPPLPHRHKHTKTHMHMHIRHSQAHEHHWHTTISEFGFQYGGAVMSAIQLETALVGAAVTLPTAPATLPTPSMTRHAAWVPSAHTASSWCSMEEEKQGDPLDEDTSRFT